MCLFFGCPCILSFLFNDNLVFIIYIYIYVYVYIGGYGYIGKPPLNFVHSINAIKGHSSS